MRNGEVKNGVPQIVIYMEKEMGVGMDMSEHLSHLVMVRMR